jgi:hypothetical protein
VHDFRFFSSAPEKLPPEAIKATINKLSQGTPFPWEEVGFLCVFRVATFFIVVLADFDLLL